MNKGTLVADLKNMVGPAGKGSEVGDLGLTRWLNEAYMITVGKIIDKNPDYFTKQVAVASVTSTGEYDLPSDFEKMILVSVSYDGTNFVKAMPLNNIGQATTLVNNNLAGDFNESEPFYYVSGSVVGILPVFTADRSGAIKYWYSYSPSEMSEDSDVPAIPARLQYVLKYWAYASYLDQNDEHAAAERMRQRFDATTDMIIDQMSHRIDDSPRTVQILDSVDLYNNYTLF